MLRIIEIFKNHNFVSFYSNHLQILNMSNPGPNESVLGTNCEWELKTIARNRQSRIRRSLSNLIERVTYFKNEKFRIQQF